MHEFVSRWLTPETAEITKRCTDKTDKINSVSSVSASLSDLGRISLRVETAREANVQSERQSWATRCPCCGAPSIERSQFCARHTLDPFTVDPAVVATAERIVLLSRAEVSEYEAALAAAPADDPYRDHDQTALAVAQRMAHGFWDPWESRKLPGWAG